MHCAALMRRVAAVLAGSLLFLACGGNIAGTDLLGGGSSGGGSSSGGSSSGGGGSSSSGGGGGGNCTAAPRCDDGHKQVPNESHCLQDDGYCYSRALCGVTIWCTGGDIQCKALPVCPPGTYEVPDCWSSKCTHVTMCGTTILCEQMCEGPQPICDAGDVQVSGPNECLSKCYSRSTCGFTIWCTSPGGPPPPPKN